MPRDLEEADTKERPADWRGLFRSVVVSSSACAVANVENNNDDIRGGVVLDIGSL